MALGGGTFTSMNKILPGAYINVISRIRSAIALSDRGIATMPFELNWGSDSGIIEITSESLQKDSLKLLGYEYTADELKAFRELFCNGLRTLYAYKLTNGGVKASCTYATAKYCGTRGNDLKIVISANVDDSDLFDVKTYLGTTLVDAQIGVEDAADLVNNDFVTFISTATLAVTAGTPLENGTNGTVSGTQYQAYLDAIESYGFNTIGCVTSDATTKRLFEAFTKRMRDEVGVKFQCVLYDYASADYEGIISVTNSADLVPWVVGAEASCNLGKSLLNKKYNGEYTVSTNYTQAQLEGFLTSGKFAFHNVNGEVRVLGDINTLVTDTPDKAKDVFSLNETMRTIDTKANSSASLFNTKYLGQVPNDADGRLSLWADFVDINKQLETMRAIQDYDPALTVVEKGNGKGDVVCNDTVIVTSTMTKIYITTIIM